MQLIRGLEPEISPMDNWESFKMAVNEKTAIRNVTVEAWKRCEINKIHKCNINYVVLSDLELKKKLLEFDYLIKAADPYMKYLSGSIQEIPHTVSLADKDGWLIGLYGSDEELSKYGGFSVGVNWSEKYIGNNGIGTCLELKEPVYIHGKEHYVTKYQDWSCLGVPITNNGEVIGALGVSVMAEYGDPSRMFIAKACVNSIEKEIGTLIEKNQEELEWEKSILNISDLIATVVHDLRNPIAIIRSLAQLGSSSNKSTYYERIIDQADDLNNTVDGLLNIFKPQELSRYSLNKVMDKIVRGMETLCFEKNIRMNFFNLDEERILSLHKNQFSRAISNLIDNAIKMTPNNGNIDIKVTEQGSNVLISIKDSGPGIPDDLQKSLFQSYVYRRKGGTGLGLFIVYHVITKLHRGSIWFNTELGKGTTFYISLPVDVIVD